MNEVIKDKIDNIDNSFDKIINFLEKINEGF